MNPLAFLEGQGFHPDKDFNGWRVQNGYTSLRDFMDRGNGNGHVLPGKQQEWSKQQAQVKDQSKNGWPKQEGQQKNQNNGWGKQMDQSKNQNNGWPKDENQQKDNHNDWLKQQDQQKNEHHLRM
ncbi:unnamed protein product [Phytophthora lilii]|uniref:Unnamed protein product n=1 Tax=Phytophthora lilii TaxID=2077276 RepID=A0A9W6TBZ1_9STRA|nr:unnamed protein product [Phytophthora lilii]